MTAVGIFTTFYNKHTPKVSWLEQISVLGSLRMETKTDAISYRQKNLSQETDKMDSRNMKPSGEKRRSFERVQEELIKNKTR